ncbi:MAG: amino acid ABC transporter permease [Clostridiaceae bacterium]
MSYVTNLLPSLVEGLITTLKIFIVTLALSLPLGVIVALGRLSKIKIINKIAQGYIWIMRGTPLLLQIVFIFFGLPVIGITFERFPAALLAFVLNYGAYYGEIFRAGIESIDKGQYEASEVLGMSNSQTFFRIVLPQMIKRVLPPVSNEVITLIKDTALVYVVGLDELLRVAKIASNRDASLVPLVVVAVFYLLLTAILTKVFQMLEKKYSYYL